MSLPIFRFLLIFGLLKISQVENLLLTGQDFNQICKEGIELSSRGINESEVVELLTKKLLDKYFSDQQPGEDKILRTIAVCGTPDNSFCSDGLIDDAYFMMKQIVAMAFKIPLFVFGSMALWPASSYNYYGSNNGYQGNSYVNYYDFYSDDYRGSPEASSVPKNTVKTETGKLPVIFLAQTSCRLVCEGEPKPSPQKSWDFHSLVETIRPMDRKNLPTLCDRVEFPKHFDPIKMSTFNEFLGQLKFEQKKPASNDFLEKIKNAFKLPVKDSPKNPGKI